MKSFVIGVVLIGSALGAQNINRQEKPARERPAVAAAIEKGAKWLASVQGGDGGWGQDGGETSYIRTGERLESTGNDVANTAVAALALLEAGPQYKKNVDRALDFILRRVEASPADGLAITDSTGTQIQRKLGPFIDTFLASMLLAKVDGTLAATQNARVRRALEKSVAKIERNQKSDGSWNVAGGWAPVLGTSMASRSLYEAQQKGVTVSQRVMVSADSYAKKSMQGGGASGAAAGVPLYQSANALEQLSRTEADRRTNSVEIATINAQLSSQKFVDGFGSMGGEEFFSYLNIGDSLKRTGGDAWKKWHTDISQKILALQNRDGTWAGHHCITGRVAVTSAAILNLGNGAAN